MRTETGAKGKCAPPEKAHKRQVIVAGIEMFRKMKDIAVAGENVGILLRQVERKEIGRGDVLLK